MLLGLLLIGVPQLIYGQETFPRNDVRDIRLNQYALTNATVYRDYETIINNATLLIRDGKVESITENGNVPSGYYEISYDGKFIYPSFIEMYSDYGLPKITSKGGLSYFGPEQILPKKKGPYNANDAIKSYMNASESFSIDPKSAGALRKQGFGSVLSHYQDGISRGTSTLVTLAETNENKVTLKTKAAAHYSFRKGTSRQSYPTSKMGAVALLRQTYLDANWYQSQKPFADLALDAWLDSQSLPQIFDGEDKFGIVRADQIGDEFGKQYIIKGNGTEYQRIQDVKKTNAYIISPLNFPKAYEVNNAFDALEVSLAQLKHWELAPANLKYLQDNKVNFVITTSDIQVASFLNNLRKAVDQGLSESTALKALTYNPSILLNVSKLIGSLNDGMIANFFISDKNIFSPKAKILENWVQGQQYVIKSDQAEIQDGNYELNVNDETSNIEIKNRSFKIIVNDSTSIKIKSKVGDDIITLNYSPYQKDYTMSLSGWRTEKGWSGRGQGEKGTWVNWSLTYVSELETEEDSKKDAESEDQPQPEGSIIYPFQAYGVSEPPSQQNILITNTTVWTNESDGVLQNTDVLIKGGKISQIGKNLSAEDAVVIDGADKHLTSGIIDEHSHIALFSVNDVAVNSGMVRMKDVIDPEDIDIYRQLSGGVTAAQLLHGSANPIGGQSALIKLRWGVSAEEMLIKGADGFIKFALGENVKRSRNASSIRFPQTRMGVEQVYVDAFTNALEYQKQWQAYNKLSTKAKSKMVAPRIDLANEAMSEILNKKRFITCHSYVQSEINMLMKVAERFNFKVNTFTHILEGYKVADKMKEHGVGASTFADWWAYKWEVRYAIPYNASIMSDVGVTVAINSDDGEMGRRLNQEAAKSVKYGNMSEEDALKMVTLNPAKLLHLEDRTGSIKVGKDADVVLWNDHPLSIYARAEKTIVDGIVYFDRERDLQLRDQISEERKRIIEKMRTAKASGAPTQPIKGPKSKDFHCDTMTSEDK